MPKKPCAPCLKRKEKIQRALSRVVVAGTKASEAVQEKVQKWTPARRYGGGE